MENINIEKRKYKKKLITVNPIIKEKIRKPIIVVFK